MLGVRKRAVVTGGAGFLGTHLVKKLVEDGYEVLIIDSGITSHPDRDSIPLAEHVYALREDVGDIKNWDELLDGVAELYWLASPASPKEYIAHPRETFTANVIGLYNAIAAIESNKLPTRILFASTSEIYGDPLVHPQVETYFGNVNTLGPRSIYDESKRMGETLLHTFSKNFVIARLFNTYGPGMRHDDGRLVTEVMSALQKGVAFDLYGGNQTRSMCYVDDTIRGILLLMQSGEHGEPYNVGNPIERTVEEIVAMITDASRLYDAPLIERRGHQQNDPMQRRPDITKIMNLGWEPMVGLQTGLRKMWVEDYATPEKAAGKTNQ